MQGGGFRERRMSRSGGVLQGRGVEGGAGWRSGWQCWVEDVIKLLLSGKLLEDKGNIEGYIRAGIKIPRQVQSGVRRPSCYLTLMGLSQ